ncbi:nonsense-mediated mRNA decay protein NMD3 family protein [Aliivibrio sp. S4TY2]|uniref:nonsense-mediated mRNA decay protein NMD3 family protein n=1 Tax=unclassified Aliivibrio TaxID=2645654 RepID=UPI00237815FD|nr:MULTISPECIES: nonsense-mediated mRNA decay protein NMD3 family protein [unclassified Aliivibrio]MDD9157890.1 nonsense-mediated mRNA decay protein NMD3 family protein [Aliivibrio sp. S4TY2]MDD9161893.1 nonsense-mediated mRNA decay protein NMD3 family protein [Aliivibrio sp. S4TY1]MDD9165890.1 nonsense-mediated mRNA decay protein NMD3 family protein [Aliivibrio sp. S4MY2]MDD9169889.1 nonsense-mediated mRNA decay protein NMD3 family protein [Aliivibrio sp. S4MY4]MDD9186940.1 nonsense-mediated 
MNELIECPKCHSDELLISDSETTVLCSECGVIKRDGVWLIESPKIVETTA